MSKECIVIVLMDAVGLYSNIPIEKSINTAVSVSEKHSDNIDMLDLEVTDVREILTYVLHNNIFKFNDKKYQQKYGISMENHLAPPLAILFMSSLEELAITSHDHTPLLYKRYIDDVLMLWCHGLDELNRFVSHFNTQHPSIKFTVEHSDNAARSINYLDLTISVSNDFRLS